MKDLENIIKNLSSEKREILDKLIKEEGMSASLFSMTSRSKKSNVAPLSFSQEQLWFLEQFKPGNAAYYRTVGFRLNGSLNIDVLERSFNEIIRRHEILRTTFTTKNGQPVQVIVPELTLNITVVDFQHVVFSEREVEIQRQATEEARKHFDLMRLPLFRIKLLCLGEKEHVLFFSIHHIISDEWSLGVLYRELLVIYKAFSEGKPLQFTDLPLQYSDFAIWRKQILDEIKEKELPYWKKQLDGSNFVLDLPTDRPRSMVQSFKGAKRFLTIPGNLYEAIKQLSRREKCTPFMTLLAALQILLYRYTGQDDIIIGSPIACRNHRETLDMIGLFLNMLVFRTDMSGNPGFHELLGRVRDVTSRAYSYQNLPFEKLVEELQPKRDLSRNPIFQVILQVSPTQVFELPGISVIPLEVDNGAAQFDLAVHLYEGDEQLKGFFEYNTDLFDTPTIDRMVKHFQTLLEGIVSNPQQLISDLPVLSQTERYQLLAEWNNTRVKYPQDLLIHQLFEAQVEKTPDAVAVVFEDKQLTYRELNCRANQLAHYLQSIGVGPDVLVGIAVERSIEMVIGLYAILKAGGAYVPIDPAYPYERIAYMLEDAQVPVLLTQSKLKSRLPSKHARVIYLDTDWDRLIADQSQEDPICQASLDNLAYVIYTSGSTGKPKGVMNTHHGILNRLLWMQETYQLTDSDRILQKTPFSFDVSVWEFFWSLMFGARLVVARPEGHKDNDYLVQIIKKQQITTIHFVPSMLQLFVETEGVDKCDSLRQVICSGEALSVELKNRFISRLDAKLHNLYGPTEAAVDVTYWECLQGNDLRTVPIGRPIANTRIYILDRHIQPVPIGVSGELHIGGVQVARGYLNRHDLTAEKFISDPFSEEPKARLYKTGDFARYLPDGNIEYLGRIDNQVKIRGFRIELGEIETVLTQHPLVREAAVGVRKDALGRTELVGYVVPDQNEKPSVESLRGYLLERLPDYMVPGIYVLLKTLPLTPNGKLDRKALPEPDQVRPEMAQAYIAPSNDVERKLSGIWCDVLCLNRVGIHDNFFDLGGNSLLAIQVIERVRQVFGDDIPVIKLFQYPTVSSFAGSLKDRAGDQVRLYRVENRAKARREAIIRRKEQKKENKIIV